MYHTSWDYGEEKGYAKCALKRATHAISLLGLVSSSLSSVYCWICLYASGLGSSFILVVVMLSWFCFDLCRCEKDCPQNCNCSTCLTQNTGKLCHLKISLACSAHPQIVPPSPTSDFLVLRKERWALNEPWRSVDSGCFIPAREWIPKLWGPWAKCKDVRVGRELTKEIVQPPIPLEEGDKDERKWTNRI